MKRFNRAIPWVGFLLVLLSSTWVCAEEEHFPKVKSPAARELEVPRNFDPKQQDSGKTPPPAEQISDWIKQLDDPLYQVREEATKHLTDAEAASLDPLLSVAN